MAKIKNSNRREYLWYYAPLLFWIIVIFVASSNTGSMTNTSRIIRPLLEFLFPTSSDADLVIVHAGIRKAAHLTFYAILGFLAIRAFNQSRGRFLQQNKIVITFALVAATAAGDEFNQSFLASRTASIYDVLLDAAGGVIGILLFAAARKIFRRQN